MNCSLPMSPLSLTAAFAAGIASSLHCLTMCGGISGALTLRARSIFPKPAVALRHQLYHHAGRLGAYGALGALGGGLGQALGEALVRWHLSSILRLFSALILVLLALQILLKIPLLRPFERLGGHFWRRALNALPQINAGTVQGSFAMGALWGLMPCGLVYSMLAIAALSADTMNGALLMVCFGAGTLPGVFGSSLLLSPLRFLRTPALARGVGLLLLAFGVLTAYSAIWV